MITLTKIAELANVSVSTASKAFSMSTEVSEETRNIIFEIAKKHGVFKKFYNAKYPKLVVGVVCSNYHSPFYPNILKDVQQKLEEYGCDMCVASSNASQMKERELYEYYTMYTDVDAILTIGRTVDLPSDFPLPRVDISPRNIDRGCPTIEINFECIKDIIEYFYRKGFDTVGFLTFLKKSGRGWKFEKFMKQIYGSYDEKYIELTPFRGGKGGYYGAKNMIKENKVPRALFCESDDVAFGAMRAFTEEGYRIPDDIAIVGWNNQPFGEYSIPTLSTINVATDEVVSESVEMLINSLSGKNSKKYIEIHSEFIERESSIIK